VAEKEASSGVPCGISLSMRYLRGKAHIEHAVSFIENKHVDVIKPYAVLSDMVQAAFRA